MLLILLGGLVFGVRAIGQLSTPPTTHLDPGDCEQPCWQGIQPGVNTREQFANRTREIGVSGFVTDYGDGIAAIFEIRPDGTLTLADVWREFGPPERVQYDPFTPRIPPPQPRQINLYYANGLIEVSTITYNGLWLTPDMQVSAIRYFSPGDPAYEIGQTQVWHGFASFRWYR
jgi:hypothetical protein